MSGNIHDTNVSKMRVLINDFINELEETIEKGDDIVEYEDIYKEKYSYIIKTSENKTDKESGTLNFSVNNYEITNLPCYYIDLTMLTIAISIG